MSVGWTILRRQNYLFLQYVTEIKSFELRFKCLYWKLSALYNKVNYLEELVYMLVENNPISVQ